ncbi:hypothetical protein [Paenibacillus tianjinensis]|uniref:Uncharacterized protein n=1 Tax=Paenibacillus tianjinensis TaxID=2810347 RepID=A0ABX7L5V0_9BACL|nr:hypothetical protein [Paenibacillus tianjinensis]QSF43482.1 hypothetical protein JRJ22_19655 [Paenibacillus tianjinensis]
MKKWDFIVNNQVVETIEQQQSKESFYWIVLDKVYSLTQRYGSSVAVCNRSGKEYSYV